jgi:hypothetical protein
MEQLQKATLVLKTHPLPLNGSNSRGSTDEYRRRMTWNNINLRLLLGDMYDKFDNFNLQLVNIASDDDRTLNGGVYINPAGEDHSDRIVTICLSGMNLLNNTYDSETNHIGTNAVLTTYEFYKDFSKEVTNSIVTFTKGNEVCNITIEYKDIYTDTSPATMSSFPQMVFIFNIFGIPKDKTK